MYGKLFRQMYEGSLVKSGWETLVTFQQLIVLANKHGEVDMTPEAIESVTRIPLKFIIKGLKELSKPDPDSRSPQEQGKRIVLLRPNTKWGWRIVNYEHYRNIRSQEERREYMRDYQAKRRADKKLTSVNNVNTELSMSTKAVSSKQEASKPCADARTRECTEILAEFYKDIFQTAVPKDPRLWNNFRAMLKAEPELTPKQFRQLLCNRLATEGANPTEPVHKWIRDIRKWTQPLDRYGKLMPQAPSWATVGMHK